MERPFISSIDISSRYTDRTSDRPVWRGDHTFNADAAKYSLMHFIEPEVANEHPDWTSAQVREHALKRFESRLSQDLSYEKQESTHTESALRWQKVEIQPGKWELATQYGDGMITLNELWAHTKEYAKTVGNQFAYNEAEHSAQLRMQDTFLSGDASGFVSVLSHPDSVRYVQMWEKQENGEIISRQLDLYKTTGTDFTATEGSLFVERLAMQLEGTGFRQDQVADIRYAHFFTTDVRIQADTVREVARTHAMEILDVGVHQIRAMPEQIERLDALGENRETSVFTSTPWFIEALEEQLKKLSVSHPDDKKSRRELSISAIQMPSVEVRSDMKGASIHDAQIRSENNDSRLSGETRIHALIAEWWISKNTLTRAELVPAGAPAVLYWFSFLTESASIMPMNKFHTVKNETRSRLPAGTDTIRGVHEPAFVWSGLVAGIRKLFRIESPVKNIVPTTVEATPLIEAHPWIEVFGNAEFGEIPPETGRLIMLFLGVLTQVSETLHTPASGRRAEKLQTMKPVSVRRESVGKLDDHPDVLMAVGSLSLELIFWHVLTAYAGCVRHTETVGKESGREQEKHGTPVEQDGGSVWILLAIIWHLAMIREMGMQSKVMVSQKMGKKKNRKGTIHIHPLAQNGVIFAFAT